ncbi:hypothetical protein OC846_002431 [Tilletia horrida]|uniref:Uncharacterized protein n=1 Tax=Tilletia horrida TaxID=155126 RepID=A0AAN6GRZ1_9BASI|nr:hypothetical protein OC845_001978 [Tilletia horrida]KAK0553590.1 hypothetical protein OC846_002431 [Tilletia horrida]KAK0567560.1 hypothetical protein OC861_002681 [Tilletia horrida]
MSESKVPNSYDSEGRFVFRLKTEEELKNEGKVNVRSFLVHSASEAEMHMAFITHIVAGLLGGAYGGLSLLGLWPYDFALLGQVILTLIKGVCVGSAVVGVSLRFSPSGRTIKKRIQQKTATKLDERIRVFSQMTMDYGIYVFLGITFFEYLPPMQMAPPSAFLTHGRVLAKHFNYEELWYPFERWATQPASIAQILRPTWILK